MKHSFKIIAIGITLILFCACSQVPKEIIQPSEMETLLVDVHLTEGMINNDNISYYEKSQKEALMNYVFKKHGITRETFDASLVWYGKNQSLYLKIYEKVLARLEEIKLRNDQLITSENQSIESPQGDTANLWLRSNYRILTTQNGLNKWEFSMDADQNYEPGDSFLLEFRMRLHPANYPLRTELVLGLTDQQDSTFLAKDTIRNEGRIKIGIALKDSVKLKRLFGRIMLPESSIRFGTMEMDSIHLMRYHPVKQENRIKNTTPTDTIKTE